ncbi:MAG: peroxiredoxin [Candidatus Peribacteraceae bacterium]|nr:peroxiredoxin [Candidatus Peribacteraceae bacterium]
MLIPDSPAPSWSGKDQSGNTLTSRNLTGSWYVLYFYPKDDTPGCTKEACGFRDRFASLSLVATVIGVSADSEKSHQLFIDKYSLPFTLIADTDKSIIRAFGADGLIFPKRVTFLVDPQGIIRKIYKDVDCAGHAEEIENDVRALQA